MAKIHKGIATGSGFAYKGKDLNFSRDVYDNFTDLNADETKYGFPEGFKTVVKDPTDNPDFSFDAYKWGTFIYTNSEWRLASYVDLDSYLTFSESNKVNLNGVSGISAAGTPVPGEVWATNGDTINITYYAKLNRSANFSVLTVGSKSVATEEWTTQQIGAATTQALTYKGGIAKQSDITNAEATGTIKVGNVYVCTTENNYTLNGGTVRLEAGDTIICKSIDGTEKWNIVQANITGAVTKSSNLASGQLVVGTGLSSVKALDAGANGKFLKVENNALTWGDVPLFNGKRNGLVPLPAEDVKMGSFLSVDGTWAKPTDTIYTLKAATAGNLGGIKIGYMSDVTHKKYAVELDNEKAFVTVPWTNTTYEKFKPATDGLVPAPGADNTTKFLRGDGSWVMPADTVYTAGTGISIDNKVIKNTGIRSIVIDPERADTLLVNNSDKITIDEVTSASNAGHANSASTASKLSTLTAGNKNTPVYFEGGVPKPIGFTIAKSVPSNAVFTDTIYTLSRNVDDHAKISLTSVNGSDIITIDNVAHATSADSATNATHATSADSAKNATNAAIANHVANNLDVFTLLSPTSETKTQEHFNGSASLIIDCVLPSEIEKMFQ